ncbi:AMP deaminase 3-like isoform X1 [Styela clava]
MGNGCSGQNAVATAPGGKTEPNEDMKKQTPQEEEDEEKWNVAITEEIGRMLVASSNNESQTILKDGDVASDLLSEMAENLFLQQKTWSSKKSSDRPFEVSSHPTPIEIDEEQIRKRLNKRRHARPALDASIYAKLQHEKEPDEQSQSKDAAPTTRPQTSKTVLKTSFQDVIGVEAEIPFQRVLISGVESEVASEEIGDLALSLIHVLGTRQHYMRLSRQSFPANISKFLAKTTGTQAQEPIFPDFIDPITEPVVTPSDEKSLVVSTKAGLITITNEAGEEVLLPCINRDIFIKNRNLLYALVADGPLKSFCYHRLSYLKSKFRLHRLLNEVSESEAMKNPGTTARRDFYNVRKVDTHIHAAACMGQKHLLGFMHEKARTEPGAAVLIRDGKTMTLKQVFDSLKLDPLFLNVDSLDVHANRQTFQRFDRFNNLYSPMGASELREIFLKTDNNTGGEYFAQIIKQVEEKLCDQKYHHLELRISIYGKSYDEWENLANWFARHKLESIHIRWLIQVPRLYDVYKAKGVVSTFQDVLDNVFRPILEATLWPNRHKAMHTFLRHVIGFDSVDDESKPEPGFMKRTSPTPDCWARDTNPSYAYYIYYMYANVARLNHMRHLRGMNTFSLRPHCGEAGHHDHLLTSFILADNISHGLVLKKIPVLQYLYYLAQIGIAMSPLSNNHLFLEYNKNPFPDYFARGLNVCLSTDDPLQFHFTMEPLMEEYAVAAQVWKLSVCDMCEIARNSVMMSGFSHKEKQRWLGESYRSEGAKSNDICRTNVPDIRIAYRHETLCDELQLLYEAIALARDSRASLFHKD